MIEPVKLVWLFPAVLLTSACGVSKAPAPSAVSMSVGGASMIVAAPDGLCVDPSSVRSNRLGGFALLDDCAALGPVSAASVPPASNGVITVSVSPGPISQPGETREAGLQSLRSFLTGPGLGALSRSGETREIKVERTLIENGKLLLLVRDPGEKPLPGLSSTFWRGFSQVKGQTVGVAVSPFPTSGGLDAALRTAHRVLNQIRAANPDVPTPPPATPPVQPTG